MSVAVFVLRTDATYEAVKITGSGGGLRDLQRIVDGRIEIFPMKRETDHGLMCYVNEDGLFRNDLQRNFLGERVLKSLGFAVNMLTGIMGNAVVINADEGLSLTPDQRDLLNRVCAAHLALSAWEDGAEEKLLDELCSAGNSKALYEGLEKVERRMRSSSSSGKKRKHPEEEKNARVVRPCSRS